MQQGVGTKVKYWRWLELALLFLAGPLILFQLRYHISLLLLPMMVVFAGLCVVVLMRDHTFKRFRFWNRPGFKKWLRPVLLLFFSLMLFTTVLFYWFEPNQIFYLPSNRPYSWLALLVVYPLFSALPQELIFRTFLFHRYKTIIPRKKHRVWLSSLCFGFAHIFYANWLAILLSTVAGYVFCKTYAQSRSTILVAVEHSLWGLWIFTLGLGGYFDSSLI
ncbi:CPBP family intramembrane metalloprotease [Alteromonadaceae bacterium BrNp21-10]|nr:CPBP family intramembrane metalloprotease [Alteromonadaceae bacterium BrNp21-10]